MSKSRMPLILGLGAAGGVGYYLYNSGGNAKAAENKFESDLHKARANIRSAIPGTGSSPDAERKLETAASEAGAKLDKAGAKIDKAWQKADQQVGQAKDHAEAYVKDARAEALKAVDKFDKTVENGASKAKSGISSWFGGK
ncbi:calcofluor white hypersensitive protein [Beauveria bassiana ARSEF 2860]|uniref:Calcofluor white hypersensitive protein n=1 Tax=Beauveria bassiana (strain ARSEF 2860) TaxID=655819 RepID=J4WC21_BEAB2|nr:calcofluor white hypersensitive protein [Beauveria bassiana ARSEF 2860]EJP67635.1 calcofluor white hypersensitive protein [Beauveria bassiana ARSEF 2860]